MSNIRRKLISDVMTKGVRQIGVNAPASEALTMMQKHSLSTVLVTDEDLILGIITERDIVRAWHRHGRLASFTCADLMQSPVVTVTDATRCLDAYHMMASRGIRHLAVVDEAGQVAGMVSEGDVARNFGLEYYMNFKDVASVMSADFCALPPTATVADALSAMVEKRQSCVIVTDGEGHPIGVLSERDVVRLCREQVPARLLEVGEAMRKPVITVKPRKRLHMAVKAMEDNHIRRLVVVNEHNVAIGLLTHHEVATGLEGDYVQYLKDIVQLQSRHLKETQEAIDEKLLLANILRSVNGTAVLASDLDYRISYATPSVLHVLGLKAEDVGGTDLRETLKGLGWAEAQNSLADAARTQRPRHYVVATAKGSKTDFQVSMLLNSQQDAQGFLVMAQRVH